MDGPIIYHVKTVLSKHLRDKIDPGKSNPQIVTLLLKLLMLLYVL